MDGLKRSHMCGNIMESMTDETICVMGWVHKKRELSKRTFIVLRDRTGVVQIVCDEEANESVYKAVKAIKSEFVIAVRGKVLKRTEENVNANLQTGKIEIEAEEIKVLSRAETPPFHVEDAKDVGYDLKLKYRYIDLRTPELQKNMILRHKTAQAVRTFLSGEGFLEIETPMLIKSTPEGARDYLVPSRVHQGSFYALPQSPQLFKQILMVSGMDKYFQIVKCFRDEDLRADRQPEFTQIDMEMSFVDMDDVMTVNERLLQHIFKEALSIEIQIPFRRMPYQEAMERFGSDKPDLRFGMELTNLTDVVGGGEFSVFNNAIENGGSVRGINAKGMGNYGRKQIDKLSDFAKNYNAKGIAWIALSKTGEIKSPIAKFFSAEAFNNIVQKMNGTPGDLLLICADKDETVFDALGNLRVEIAKQNNLFDKDEFNFLWVTEFPLLSYNEEEERYEAIHHPFTAPMDSDFETNPQNARAKAYDIVLNGVELGGGSIRIHDSGVQSKIFELLGFTKEAAKDRFGFLLEAFQYGVPPHGGLAFGFDRLIMLMAKTDTIRDVIAFPKVKDASCPMTGAPYTVDAKQLDELGICVKTPEGGIDG